MKFSALTILVAATFTANLSLACTPGHSYCFKNLPKDYQDSATKLVVDWESDSGENVPNMAQTYFYCDKGPKMTSGLPFLVFKGWCSKGCHTRFRAITKSDKCKGSLLHIETHEPDVHFEIPPSP